MLISRLMKAELIKDAGHVPFHGGHGDHQFVRDAGRRPLACMPVGVPRRSWSVEFETFGTSQPCFSGYAQTAGWVDGDTGARASAGLL